MPIINFNGKLVPETSPLPLRENRGFLYGDGFFETIRLINGTPVHLEDHLDRMNRSFQFLHLEPPFKTDPETLAKVIGNLAAANQILKGGRVRITFFRESKGYYTPASDQCGYLAECSPLDENRYSLNQKGLHLALYGQNFKPATPLQSLKTINALIYVLAGIFARNQQCDDALIMNDYENIIETTSSNLFIVKQNTITTPGLDEGCIPGVMRRNMLKIIEHKTEYKLERGNIRLHDIIEADEIFLTNAIRGVQWVVAFKDKRYYHTVATHLVSLLNEGL
jgi:branched-chain amino acid aminotransferase